MIRLFKLIFCFIFFSAILAAYEPLLLKENLKKAQKGDYVVLLQGKSYTLFHIYDAKPAHLTIEEVSIPSALASSEVKSWPAWLQKGAPMNTSWVHYNIDLNQGILSHYYSFTKNGWFIVPEAENFLGTLLQLELTPVPLSERKRVGTAKKIESRPLWQPNMVINGQIVKNVPFQAYTTVWPKDGGPLSGKTIEIYLPQDSNLYPAYFPYWLQTRVGLAQAKVRIVDSGRGLVSPKPPVINK